MNQLLTETITNTVKKVMLEESLVEVEASGRHVHLNREAIDYLFGEGYQLTKARNLSQPGQFVCKERLTLVGPKGKLENVVILGPERKESQVEISLTDANALGLQVPVRESGDIEGSPGITLVHQGRQLELDKGLIIAKRHIHVSPDDAEILDVENKEIVQVKVFGERSLIFDEVVIRVHPNFYTYMHIDYDEANACGFSKGTLAKIIKKSNRQAPEAKQSTVREKKNASEKQIELDQKLITESDLQKLYLQKVKHIRIPSTSIITPLAQDYIREFAFKITRCEENDG